MTTCNVTFSTASVTLVLSNRPYSGRTSIIDINDLLEAMCEEQDGAKATAGVLERITIGNDGDLVLHMTYESPEDLMLVDVDADKIRTFLNEAWDDDEESSLAAVGL